MVIDLLAANAKVVLLSPAKADLFIAKHIAESADVLIA